MLTLYEINGTGLKRRENTLGPGQAVWLDLLNPSREEEAEVERLTAIQVPTREEMHEIEVSSRLYQEGGAHYMTANIMYAVDSPDPQTTAVTFILTEHRLITVRYADPRAIQLFLNRAGKGDVSCGSPVAILLGVLEAVIDREADLIERLQADSEKVAHTIFDMKGNSRSRTSRYDIVLRQIGRIGEINSRARESLLSLGRLLTYLSQIVRLRQEDATILERIRTEERDVQSLSDHVAYMGGRLTFMLDASLGMVSIEQNQIIKLFSVVAVMLMPPTLVASIYGMNFRHMPELGWPWGYPMALGLMVLSAALPYFYFRRKGWL